MKNKMIALTLAILLICSVAIPASAKVIETTGSSGGCGYSTYNSCGYVTFNSILQYDYSSSGDYSDYTLQVYVERFVTTSSGGTYNGITVSTPATRITNAYGTSDIPFAYINCTHKINNSTVKTIKVDAN